MKTNHIPLESLIPKGAVSFKITDGELHTVTLKEGLSKKRQSYLHIPGTFRLPFRIDIRLKVNSPMFKLNVGKGNIMFTGSLNRGGFGIRRVDILTGKEEQTKYDYDNVMLMDNYVDVSVVYGNKLMWVELNGQYCYYTGKAPYMALLESNAVPEECNDGLALEIACGENVELVIKSLIITEYENDVPDHYDEIIHMPELSTFDWYIKSLPHEIRDEAIKTDIFLMKDLKATLRFKKSINKDGKLSYESPCGFCYTMNRYSIGESHAVNWKGKMGAVLNKLSETSPEFADRMFSNIHAHISSRGGEKCNQCSSISCANMESIEYDGETRRSCGGAMHFQWLPSEFEDVRKIAAVVQEIVRASDKG